MCIRDRTTVDIERLVWHLRVLRLHTVVVSLHLNIIVCLVDLAIMSAEHVIKSVGKECNEEKDGYTDANPQADFF